MAQIDAENVVVAAMQPLADLDVPLVLRTSIERQSQNLLGLAATLLQTGMGEQQVRAVIDQACSSYRDELTSAILALRKRHET